MRTFQDPDYGSCAEIEHGGVRAVIAPHRGMSLVDFSVDGVGILDYSRRDIFLKFRKGLGPLILPHFNQRKRLPWVDDGRFPHAAHLRAHGLHDPFQHGVGRYASWLFEETANGVVGRIRGSDRLEGVSLRELNGFDFSAAVGYSLDGRGLSIAFELSGESPVEAGIHFYYDLVNPATASVTLPVAGEAAPRFLPLDRAYDTVFHPPLNAADEATYLLRTDRYTLRTTVKVRGSAEETFDSVTVFRPEGATFVCVEPVTSDIIRKNEKLRVRGTVLLTPAVAGRP